MTRSNKKQDERDILDAYLAVRGLTGVVRDGPDPPDLLVTIDGSVVGFEITKYHQQQKTDSNHTPREVEAAWDKLRQYEVEHRKTRPELDDLNVLLNFLALRVPSGKEIRAFVTAVWDQIAAARAGIGAKLTVLEIGPTSPLILRKYLQTIDISEAGCDMEWNWNHDVRRIGTSDDELLAVIGPKLRLCLTCPDVASNRLIVRGFRSRLSEMAAHISAEHLNGFLRLNAALKAGPFDEVALLCIRNFVWTREHGWHRL